MEANYSTLEVAPQRTESPWSSPTLSQPHPDKIPLPYSPPPHYTGMEVAASTEPQVVHNGSHKQTVDVSAYGEPGAASAGSEEDGLESTKERGAASVAFWRKRRWWIIAATVLICVIIAAVVGGVVGSRKSSTSDSAPLDSNSGSISTATATATKPTSTSKAVERLGIASIGYTSTNDRHRIYTLGKSGEILDGLYQNNQWSFQGLNIIAGNGTSLAVAITDPGFNQTIHMIYIDRDNILQSAQWRDTTKSWSIGNLGVQRYIAGANTNLGLTVDSCIDGCPNRPLLAYQDRSGSVFIANYTSLSTNSTPSWSSTKLAISAQPGTALAMQSTATNGSADIINLYYQKLDGAMAQASWNRRAWTSEAHTFRQIAPGAQIAASATNQVNGTDAYIHLLSLDNTGVAVDTFETSTSTWLPVQHPPSMSNQTGTNITYGSISIDKMGSAFVVAEKEDGAFKSQIMAWQVSATSGDVTGAALQWTYNGTVPIGNNWGLS